MANIKFTELASAPNADLADIICAVQSGANVQMTQQQVLDLFRDNLILNYAGDPNTNVAGTVYELLYDTTNNALYICTTTGTAATAVWKLVSIDISGMSDGQLIIGDTAAGVPSKATLTGGTNINVTNGAGSITIGTTGLAAFSWNEITTTSDTMIGDNGYLANNASLVTLTLPTTAALGDEIIVIAKGAGGFRIAQNAGQTVYSDGTSTTTGVGGYIDAVQNNSISLIALDTTTNDWILKSANGILTFN